MKQILLNEFHKIKIGSEIKYIRNWDKNEIFGFLKEILPNTGQYKLVRGRFTWTHTIRYEKYKYFNLAYNYARGFIKSGRAFKHLKNIQNG